VGRSSKAGADGHKFRDYFSTQVEACTSGLLLGTEPDLQKEFERFTCVVFLSGDIAPISSRIDSADDATLDVLVKWSDIDIVIVPCADPAHKMSENREETFFEGEEIAIYIDRDGARGVTFYRQQIENARADSLSRHSEKIAIDILYESYF